MRTSPDGREVARRVRADPATARIPIVCRSSILTCGGPLARISHDACVPKPCALDDLVATVALDRRALDRRALGGLSAPRDAHAQALTSGARGRVRVTVVPTPSALSTVIDPPCRAIIACAPARPRPLPALPRVVAGR